jgi:hypothetical protein
VKRTLRNLGVSVGMVVALLGVPELVLQVLDWPPQGIYEDPNQPVWRLRAGLVDAQVRFPEQDRTFPLHTNSLGFRGPEPVAPHTVCLGDSTTFGWGVTQDEAWPALLGVALGVEVLNAGTPGYSTHQGLAELDRALSAGAERVILAYLVRDADPAPVPDSERGPGPSTGGLKLPQALRSLRPPGPTTPTGDAQRVPPEQFSENLTALVDRVRAAGAEPVLLAFPMVEPATEHVAVLEDLGALSPTLPRDAFFAEDPIHLTPQGNAELAAWLAEHL